MNQDHDQDTELLKRTKRLPMVVPVQVRCAGVRCLAYRDEQGVWKSYYTGEPLTGNIEIIPM